MRYEAPYRDRYEWPVSVQSTAALDDYVRAVDLILSGNIGAQECLQRALGNDDRFALAYAALATIEQREGRLDNARAAVHLALECALDTTRRERQHVEVIAEAIRGNSSRALRLAKEHLLEFPRDAYILNQYRILRVGPGCREMNAAILDTIEQLEPVYGDDWFYTGIRSYYLHELNRFEESRAYAEKSLSGNPRNGGAAHNMAHCFYETADYRGGLDFLGDWITDYHPTAPNYSHLNWHMALFEITQGRYQRSFEIYQECIRPSVLRHEVGTMGPPIADATSVLWRYKLYGSPAERAVDWREIEEFAATVAASHTTPFNDAHCALAFAATGNDRAMTALIDKLRSSSANGNAVVAEVALPLILGIGAFGHGAYEETVRHIEPILDDIIRVSGSQAQRMVFEETLLRAHMLTDRYDKAEEMLRKRLEHRHSGRDFYWLAEAQTRQGDHESALVQLEQGSWYWLEADSGLPEVNRARALLKR